MSYLFYKGIRVYHRLDCIRNKQFVVSVDKGDRRFFLNFSSVDVFEEWYYCIEPKERTMNEVVYTDKRKLVLDIDGIEDGVLHMFDFERHMSSRIREVFAALGIGNPEVVMYKMTDDNGDVCEDKLSYHAVVSNFIFDAHTCMGLAMIISAKQAWEKCVDTGVYKTVQCIRMEGSTKYEEHRWKHICDDTIDFKSGLLSCFEGTVESDVICKSRNYVSHIVFAPLEGIDMSQFKVGKPKMSYVPLYRVRPGYCPQCNRVHDKENAAIRYDSNGCPSFMCWRYRTNA